MSLATLLAKIDVKIEAVLDAGPAAYVDYRIGDKSVNKSDYLDFLLKARKDLIDQASTSETEIGTMNYDWDIDEFGQDNGEYI